MSHLSPTAIEWLRTHHGVATATRLTKLGISRARRDRLVTNGVLTTPWRGVFVLAGTPSTLEQRCALLSAAHPAGFITGPTAGMLAELRRMPPSAGIHLAIRHGVHLPDQSGIIRRQTRALIPRDRRIRPDGIVVASWPRLAFDLAADLRQIDHHSVLQQLLDRRLVTVAELVSIGGRLCHPARRGSTTFARSLRALTPGGAQDSHAEVVLAERLRGCGVPVEAQVAVTAPGSPTIHLDLGVPADRWGVELDLHPEHRSLEGHQLDAQRRHVSFRAAWIVETITELDMATLDDAVARLVSSYHTARARLRSVG